MTAAEVRHVHGALQTNAVSLVSAAGRGCYATVSLLSHSCVPNLEPAADPGRVMRLRAKRRISRGEQLTMRSEPGHLYTDRIWNRQLYNIHSKPILFEEG